MNTFKVRLLALLLVVCMVAPFAACAKTEKKDVPAEPTPVPTQLPAQETPDDPGNPVEFTVTTAYSSNMVLQRDRILTVWGSSENPGAYIYVDFMGETRYGQVSDDGSWEIKLSPHEATKEEQTMKIYPKNGEPVEFSGILIGDVYFINGQSNAELVLGGGCYQYTKGMKYGADTPIRFYVSGYGDASAHTDIQDEAQDYPINTKTKWRGCKGTYVNQCSALGFFFAYNLIQQVDVPVGLVMTCVGGATLSELMPREMAEEHELSGGNFHIGGLYNMMMYPFLKMEFKSMIFYQGESECGNPYYIDNYGKLLNEYVEYLRDITNNDFTFYSVQLSSHTKVGARNWPYLHDIRNSQESANISNSYWIPCYDIGTTDEDADWAHPTKKHILGQRVADVVLAVEFGIDTVENVGAPTAKSVSWGKESCIITFTNVGEGLTLQAGENPEGFRLVCGTEALKAEAKIIDKDKIEVFYPYDMEKSEFAAVAYAYFQPNTAENSNLMNSHGMPALAFRRDR